MTLLTLCTDACGINLLRRHFGRDWPASFRAERSTANHRTEVMSKTTMAPGFVLDPRSGGYISITEIEPGSALAKAVVRRAWKESSEARKQIRRVHAIARTLGVKVKDI